MLSAIKTPMWMRVISVCEDCTCSQISKNENITYAHVWAILNEFEKRKWISRDRSGRDRVIKMTVCGTDVRFAAKELISLVRGVEE